MTTTNEPRRRASARELVPPLIIGTLGTIGFVAAYLLVPGYRPVDLLLLLVVASCAVGYRQRTLRGLASIAALYVATGVAATFYNPAAPYVGSPFGDFREQVPRSIYAYTFCVLTFVAWAALEALSRGLFKDVSLPALRILDNLGGALLYPVVGFLVAGILFNAFGYKGLRHPVGKLNPTFKQVVRIHYLSQSFWFPAGEPFLYTYDLD